MLLFLQVDALTILHQRINDFLVCLCMFISIGAAFVNRIVFLFYPQIVFLVFFFFFSFCWICAASVTYTTVRGNTRSLTPEQGQESNPHSQAHDVRFLTL